MRDFSGVGEFSDHGISENSIAIDHRHQLFSNATLLEMEQAEFTVPVNNPLRIYKSADMCFLTGAYYITAPGGAGNVQYPPTILPLEFRPKYAMLIPYISEVTDGAFTGDTSVGFDRLLPDGKLGLDDLVFALDQSIYIYDFLYRMG